MIRPGPEPAARDDLVFTHQAQLDRGAPKVSRQNHAPSCPAPRPKARPHRRNPTAKAICVTVISGSIFWRGNIIFSLIWLPVQFSAHFPSAHPNVGAAGNGESRFKLWLCILPKNIVGVVSGRQRIGELIKLRMPVAEEDRLIAFAFVIVPDVFGRSRVAVSLPGPVSQENFARGPQAYF